jgi:integration host factor subunit alpha
MGGLFSCVKHGLRSCWHRLLTYNNNEKIKAGSMALTKADFAAQLLNELGLSKPMAKDLVELFFEEIKATLEHAESVKISGFGKFELRDKVARPGRNPKTGEEIPITARRVVTFKPGTILKSKIDLMGTAS